MRSGPRLLAPDRRLRGHGRQPLRPLPLAAPRRICSPFALPHRDNDDMTSRRTTVQNVVKALDAVCEAWDAGDRSPQLIREWLNATLHLVHTYGTSWGTEYRDLVKVELVKLAAQLRENPDWLWTEASEVRLLLVSTRLCCSSRDRHGWAGLVQHGVRRNVVSAAQHALQPQRPVGTRVDGQLQTAVAWTSEAWRLATRTRVSFSCASSSARQDGTRH